MLRYSLKRLLSLVISLVVASLIIFAVIEVAPGDPARFMLGINAQPDTVAALRAELGLDVPKTQRYLAWVGGMLSGDFGISYTYRVPVGQMIADRMVYSKHTSPHVTAYVEADLTNMVNWRNANKVAFQEKDFRVNTIEYRRYQKS